MLNLVRMVPMTKEKYHEEINKKNYNWKSMQIQSEGKEDGIGNFHNKKNTLIEFYDITIECRETIQC